MIPIAGVIGAGLRAAQMYGGLAAAGAVAGWKNYNAWSDLWHELFRDPPRPPPMFNPGHYKMNGGGWVQYGTCVGNVPAHYIYPVYATFGAPPVSAPCTTQAGPVSETIGDLSNKYGLWYGYHARTTYGHARYDRFFRRPVIPGTYPGARPGPTWTGSGRGMAKPGRRVFAPPYMPSIHPEAAPILGEPTALPIPVPRPLLPKAQRLVRSHSYAVPGVYIGLRPRELPHIPRPFPPAVPVPVPVPPGVIVVPEPLNPAIPVNPSIVMTPGVVAGARAHVQARPGPNVKERKVALTVRGMPARVIGSVGEFAEWVDVFHDALPYYFKAKPVCKQVPNTRMAREVRRELQREYLVDIQRHFRTTFDKKGLINPGRVTFDTRRGGNIPIVCRKPTMTEKMNAVYKHAQHLDMHKVGKGLFYEQIEDAYIGLAGQAFAKASRSTGNPAGLLLGPAL